MSAKLIPLQALPDVSIEEVILEPLLCFENSIITLAVCKPQKIFCKVNRLFVIKCTRRNCCYPHFFRHPSRKRPVSAGTVSFAKVSTSQVIHISEFCWTYLGIGSAGIATVFSWRYFSGKSMLEVSVMMKKPPSGTMGCIPPVFNASHKRPLFLLYSSATQK